MFASHSYQAPEADHRPYLDWLRIFIVFWLIPFHASRIYDVWHPYYVKGEHLSLGLSVVFGFFATWGMELLFVVAGQASGYALGRRGPRGYRGERVHRLCIPALFGLLVLVPPMAYMGRAWRTGAAEGFLSFYPRYVRIWEAGDRYGGAFTPGHLWFIIYLFGFALISGPISRALRGDRGRRVVGALAPALARPGRVLLLAAPVALAALIPWDGGGSPVYYLVLYVIGLGLAIDERFNEGIDRSMGHALALGAMLTPLIFMSGAQRGLGLSGLAAAALAVDSWCWVVVALAGARRYASRGHRLLHYAREAAFPYYILHEPVVVALGLAVVRRNTETWAGFALVSLGALAITVGLYELLIRRLPALRYLFGMRPLPPRPAEAPPAAEPGESSRPSRPA